MLKAALLAVLAASASALALSPKMAALSTRLSAAQASVTAAKTPIEIVNAQEAVDALFDRMDVQRNLERVACSQYTPPTVESLLIQLKVAQAAFKKAKTPIEMVNAQEVIDALADRMELADWLSHPSTPLVKISGLGKPSVRDDAIIEKMKKLVDAPFPVVTQSWKQVELHEL